jgi:hypothetical protein
MFSFLQRQVYIQTKKIYQKKITPKNNKDKNVNRYAVKGGKT